LSSWNDGPARQAIIRFVAEVTREGGSGYVPPAGRIAVFDNDGTLWNEHPLYVQAVFATDRARALSAVQPALAEKPAFKAVLGNDFTALAATGEPGIAELMMLTHAGMTTDEFQSIVERWFAEARHPRFHRPFTDLAYQPMVELLDYLRLRGFKTYIVSGGGIEFMRPIAERMYGIPPEQVIGSSIKTRFERRGGAPVLLRLPEIDLVDDHAGKPVGIQRAIGRRPILAFGNSDGDLEMLQYTDAGSGPRLMLLLHHDDAEREYAYDRETPVGRLDKAWDEATRRGWIVVSMKQDFATVFRSAAAR
jgi:phosphoserine phosphatase